MRVLKKTFQILFLILLVLIFLASVLVIISSAAQQGEKGYAGAFGYTFESVQSPSMSGPNGFEEGDLIVGKIIDADTVIEVGTVISFNDFSDEGIAMVKSHRVVEIGEVDGTTVYYTQGDNREACPVRDSGYRTRATIRSVYQFKLGGVGKALDALKSPLGFLALAIPIGIYILYEIFVLISIFMNNKKQQMLKETADAKEAIIREYLAAQSQAKEEKKDKPEEEKTEPDTSVK